MSLRCCPTLGLLGVVALACGEPEPAGPRGDIPEPVQRAFDHSCAESGCHDASARASGLSLDPRDSPYIVGGDAYQSELPLVALGDVDGSYLAIKLLPPGQIPEGVERSYDRMPLGEPDEQDEQNVQTILQWIADPPPATGTTTGRVEGDNSSSSVGGSDDSGTGSSSGAADTTSTGSGSTTTSGDNPSRPACSVEIVTEGEIIDPLNKGDAAGQFPPSVGDVLEDRCGCHTLADRELNTEFPGLLAPGNSLFLEHGDMSRALGDSTLGAVMQDEIFGTMGMPPGSCPIIPADEEAILQKWFDDGLPDGARFVPP